MTMKCNALIQAEIEYLKKYLKGVITSSDRKVFEKRLNELEVCLKARRIFGHR